LYPFEGPVLHCRGSTEHLVLYLNESVIHEIRNNASPIFRAGPRIPRQDTSVRFEPTEAATDLVSVGTVKAATEVLPEVQL
jgi:hypothetical protein